LAWAIETIETAIQQDQFEQQYRKEEAERIADENRYFDDLPY